MLSKMSYAMNASPIDEDEEDDEEDEDDCNMEDENDIPEESHSL